MKLPNVESAIVADSKLTEYLLSAAHPEGRGKAALFLARGFRPDRLDEIRSAFKSLAVANPVLRVSESAHGTKYVIEGSLQTPIGRPLHIRTIWMVDRGGTIPRLISAYPV